MKKSEIIYRGLAFILLGLVFVMFTFAHAYAGKVFQIEPKSDKKMKIGVIDLISDLEVAAIANNLYIKESKARGWTCHVYDTKGNSPEAGNIMNNLIIAGFDAIIVNWTNPKFFEAQAKKAFAKGIPVFGNHASKPVDGMVADFSGSNYSQGALVADYLVNHTKADDGFVLIYSGTVPCNVERSIGAKAVLDANNRKIVQELTWTGGSDLLQWGYDMVNSTLLGDTEKKIKAIWTSYEGYSIAAARAVGDRGRTDIIVGGVDDSPRTYTELRKLAALQMEVGLIGDFDIMIKKMFEELDNIFAGKEFKVQQFLFPSYIVTKDTLPPEGYFFKKSGNYSGPKDF